MRVFSTTECDAIEHCSFARACDIARSKADKPVKLFQLAPGDTLEVDAVPSSLFFIERGFVRVGDRSADGEANYLTFHGRGEALNLLQVFASVKATYSLTALTDTRVCQIAFSSSLDQDELSDLLFDSVDNLSLSVQASMSDIWMLRGRSVKERVKRFLSNAARFCSPDESGKVNLMMSQSEMARAVRADRASITKELKALEKEGVLNLKYGGISFDPAKAPLNPLVQ